MLFTLLQERLVAHLRNRVRAGELTERGLARVVGMSQPHMHNVLKGVRALSADYADQIVTQFQLSVSDLLTAREIGIAAPPAPGVSLILRLEGRAGPACRMGERAIGTDPISRAMVERVAYPAMLELAHDDAIFPYFQAGDLALIDRSRVEREALDPEAAYLVETEIGTLVRNLRAGGTRLFLLTPQTLEEPRKWQSLSLSGRNLAEFVKGRIAWIGRSSPGSSPASS